MYLLQFKDWIIGMFAVIVLVVSAAYFYSSVNSFYQQEQVQFSKLTDKDIDGIMAVKAEMYAASMETE
jgi:uncharacterized protein YpmB